MLAKVSDVSLKQLAILDLSHPGNADDVMRLADGWWKLAAKQPEANRVEIRRHATSLYKTVLEGTTGLRRALLEHRIAEAAVVPAGPAQAGSAVKPRRGSPLPNALLALRFDEKDFYKVGDDTFVKDLSGRENKVMVHGATIVEGKAGRGLHFDGKSWLEVGGTYPDHAKPRSVFARAKAVEAHGASTVVNYGENGPGCWFDFNADFRGP